jgi:hypothetical protein
MQLTAKGTRHLQLRPYALLPAPRLLAWQSSLLLLLICVRTVPERQLLIFEFELMMKLAANHLHLKLGNRP